MSDLFEALANPARRQILVLLRARDLTAGEIADLLPLAKSTLSQHFNVLKAAGLIRATRGGTTITYALNASVVEEGLMDIMRLLKLDRKTKEKRSWDRRSGLAGSPSRSR
jgi:ArsR family transcriptional regulator, arsenate/arsenite/antimonite-responsive transcriptional repressor